MTIRIPAPVEAAAIAARFAEDTESTAAASDVANIPAVMNVCRAIDIAGTVSMGTTTETTSADVASTVNE